MPWDHRRFWFVDLVVLVLIGLFMAALFLPPVTRSREAARRNQCSCKLKQIGIALQNHHDVHKRFPAVSNQGNPEGLASVWWPDPGSAADSGAVPSAGYTTAAGTTAATAGYSWIVMILPYMDEVPLYNTIVRASDKFSADAFTPYDVGVPTNDDSEAANDVGKTFSVQMVHGGKTIRKHFADIQLDEVTCPSYAGTALVAASPYAGSPPGNPPASYGYPRGSERLGSPPQLAAITNYVTLSATHFTCMQYSTTPNLAATTEIPEGAEAPNGMIVPGTGLPLKACTDGASRTLMVAETVEPAMNCWYDGTTAWTTGINPNTVSPFPPKNQVDPTWNPLGFWTVPTGGENALNLGPVPDAKKIYCPALDGYCASPRMISWGPSSNHSGAIVLHVAVDASVHNITSDIDPTVYMHLITIAGREPDAFPDIDAP